MVLSMLHQITPANRHGQAVAMRIMMVNASSVTTPMLFGAAGGVVGVTLVFWVTAVVVGLAAPWVSGCAGPVWVPLRRPRLDSGPDVID